MCLKDSRNGPLLRSSRKHFYTGFTVVELVIVIAVIAILAAVVLPTYQNAIRKSRRMDARIALSTIAQLMERYSTQNNSYVGATLASSGQPPVIGTLPYSNLSENGIYSISIGTPTANEFTILATPIGDQSLDVCSSFTLDQAGTRGPASLASQCW